jgi:hypothetical protein
LQSITNRYGVKIGLALIPGLLEPDLVSFVHVGARDFYPMCHGWRHINHGAGNNPCEFGNGRPRAAARADAERALHTFCRHFPGVPPIFVPPFNRIDAAMVRELARLGFVGLSGSQRPLERRVARLIDRFEWTPVINLARSEFLPRIDAQIDLIDWKSGSARDACDVAEMLVAQLRLRRKGFLTLHSPIGLLTHHRVHDEKIWHLLESVVAFLKEDLGIEFNEISRSFQTRVELRSVAN